MYTGHVPANQEGDVEGFIKVVGCWCSGEQQQHAARVWSYDPINAKQHDASRQKIDGVVTLISE